MFHIHKSIGQKKHYKMRWLKGAMWGRQFETYPKSTISQDHLWKGI